MENPTPQPQIPLKTRSINVSGYRCVIDLTRGIYPFFTYEIRGRMHRKMSNNIVVTGEAGVSKTYTGAFAAKLLNRKFSIQDLVMNFKMYMTEIVHYGKTNVPIEFDEPQEDLDKRDWYKDINKALVKTITSQRFRRRPLIIPIINQNLLDLNLRKYLLNYHMVLTNRGIGTVYKISASQFEDKIYRRRVCDIQYGMMDINKCSKDSCLGCKTLHKEHPEGGFTCDLWRAAYERMKEKIMNERDTKTLDGAKKAEAQKMTDKEIILAIKFDISDMLGMKGGKPSIDPAAIGIKVEERLGIIIGMQRCYRLRRLLMREYPEYA